MSFTSRDAADLASILRAAAQAEVMPRFRRLGEADVRTKSGPVDLVTIADEAAERHIASGLERRFPGALIVGEEAVAGDRRLLDALASAPLAFVVDPIDGTFNYASGVPLFGVMAAALTHGEVVLAAIHDPLGDDTALALRGEGAWIEATDGRWTDLRVAEPVPPGHMNGVVSWQFLPEPARSRICGRLSALGLVWAYRCSVHEYRLAASGGCHMLVYRRLLPWDHAPGGLIHREAGGYSAHFDGTPYRVDRVNDGLICAPGPRQFRGVAGGVVRELIGAMLAELNGSAGKRCHFSTNEIL